MFQAFRKRVARLAKNGLPAYYVYDSTPLGQYWRNGLPLGIVYHPGHPRDTLNLNRIFGYLISF